MSYLTLHEGERVRNSWKCEWWVPNSTPHPGALVLTNTRVVALEGTGIEGFWEPKPKRWVIIVDRELLELPPVRRSEPFNEKVTLAIAGRNLMLRTATAYAAMEDIEHARTNAVAKAAPVHEGPHEREVVIKEVVKIPCKYCGNLNLQADKKCSACGATIG